MENDEGTAGPVTRLPRPLRKVVRLGDLPWVRRAVAAAVGFVVFALGVVYLSLGRLPDVTSLMVIGGEWVRPGAPAVVRVAAREADTKRSVPVRVTGVTLDGSPAALSIEDDRPAIVRFRVPDGAKGQVALGLDVEAKDRKERIAITFPVVETAGWDEPDLPMLDRSGGKLPDVTTAHRVQVLPEAGALATDMENRVFVRVLDLEGRPVGGARVVVSHQALPEGRVERRTDASGLADLSFVAKQLSYRLEILVEEETPEGPRVTRTDRLLRPAGRQMSLHLEPPVVRPGEAPRPRLTTWRPDTEVWCDLHQGGALVWSRRLVSTREPSTLALDPLPEGLHRLQCQDHPWAPGESFATLPIVVSSGRSLDALLAEVRLRGLVPEPSAGAPPGTDEKLASAFWLAVLRRPPQPPELLVNTRPTDLASRAQAHRERKDDLLLAMGGVFLLVFLWLAETILKSVLEKRDRMRAFAIEAALDSSGGPGAAGGVLPDVDELLVAGYRQRESLVKLRSALLAFTLFGTLVGAVAGILGLLRLVG